MLEINGRDFANYQEGTETWRWYSTNAALVANSLTTCTEIPRSLQNALIEWKKTSEPCLKALKTEREMKKTGMRGKRRQKPFTALWGQTLCVYIHTAPQFVRTPDELLLNSISFLSATGSTAATIWTSQKPQRMSTSTNPHQVWPSLFQNWWSLEHLRSRLSWNTNTQICAQQWQPMKAPPPSTEHRAGACSQLPPGVARWS